MTTPAVIVAEAQNLPALIDRAARILAGARTAAEVLEARDVASLAYDAAKRASRFQRAKAAHDDLIAATHRAQADALEIEALAKRRLADEYDAAQERGEVATGREGRSLGVARDNAQIATVADLGLRRDQIHDARLIRDAETADPGIVRRTLDARLARGDDARRFMRRKGKECLDEADRLDALYAAVANDGPDAAGARPDVLS